MQSLFIPLVHFSYFLILKDLVHSTIKESGVYARYIKLRNEYKVRNGDIIFG